MEWRVQKAEVVDEPYLKSLIRERRIDTVAFRKFDGIIKIREIVLVEHTPDSVVVVLLLPGFNGEFYYLHGAFRFYGGNDANYTQEGVKNLVKRF